MSLVKLMAIEPVNSHRPGDTFEAPEREANQLIQKGLAKMDAPVRNKMAQAPANKANPSPAAGRVQRSSASPVARASAKTTATRSNRGAQPEKTGE